MLLVYIVNGCIPMNFSKFSISPQYRALIFILCFVGRRVSHFGVHVLSIISVLVGVACSFPILSGP